MERSIGHLGVSDFNTRVLLGMEPSFTAALLQGINFDVDVGTIPEDVLPSGGLYNWPTALETLEIVSTSANDAAAGTGARTVLVSGLNLAFATVSETVTLNGLTPVALVNQYYRINLMQVATVGSTSQNQGEIQLRRTSDAVRRFTIPALYGRGQSGVYTVPAGFTGYWRDAIFTQYEATSTNSFSSYQLYTRVAGGPWISRLFTTTSTASPNIVVQPTLTNPIPAGSDIRVQATVVGVSNTVCTSSVTILLQRV